MPMGMSKMYIVYVSCATEYYEILKKRDCENIMLINLGRVHA